MTLNVCADNFLNNVLTFSAYETYKFYNQHLKIVLQYFERKGILYAEQINYDNVCKFILWQKEKQLSNSTINKRILVLKCILKFNDCSCLRDLEKIKKLKEKQTCFNYLSNNDMRLLLEYIHNSSINTQNKAILSVFIDTGIRLSELINIRLNNLNLKDNSILLEDTKTDINRYVFFTERTNFYLTEYLKDDSINSAYLFDVTKSGIRSIFNRTGKRLNFVKFHPHMLRHTYATILVNSNTNLEFIRLTMGHNNLATTKRYLHLTNEDLKKTYDEQFHLNA